MKNIVSVILFLFLSLSAVHAERGDVPREHRGVPAWGVPENAELVSNTVIVKFRASIEHRLGKHGVSAPALSPVLARYGVRTMTQMYPRHSSTWMTDGTEIALQRMYRIEFTEDVHPMDVARAFRALPEVEYADPEVVQHLLYAPNDPRLIEQYALVNVEAQKAWDLTTGSGDVVIAIVDSGVMLTHEDLEDRIWVHPGEDLDGDGVFTEADIDSIDNDGNGYVDDIVGIDLVGPSLIIGGNYYDNDPDPTAQGHPHGTHVAGIAAASGDNGKGIAGLAYDCRIMPIKCGADRYAPSILRGYDGIVYAADNGADVINCSWGGGGYLESQKEMIDYAVSKGAVVIAAAGNSGSERIHTPGAYPNVLCVANTTEGDRAAGSTTYGPWVDVSAPGSAILSCVIGSPQSYQKFTGTSMASPLVAGLAGLVRSHRPDLSPEQVFEQIRVTSDPIDASQDPRYHGKIGRGRINAYRALTESSPAVRLVDWTLSDSLYGNNDGFPDQGEKLTVTMHWENLLEPTQNAVITLSSSSIRATVVQGSFTAGAIPTNGTVSNEDDPFVILLDDWPAPNDQVDLIYTVEDGEYVDQGGVFFIQQPSYRDHDINDILLTLTSDGNVGFDDLSSVTGSGMRYRDNENVLFEGAFMMGAVVNQSPLVVDVARTGSGSQMEDFLGEQLYRISTPGLIAEQEGYGVFWDANAPLSSRLQTEVTLKSFAFTRPEARNMIFLRYTIHNYSGNRQEDLHAGLFFDWDIGSNSQTDIALYEGDFNLAVCFDTVGTPRTPVTVGLLHLTPEHGTTYWGINNRDRDDSLSIGIYNGFTKEEKWKALSTGVVQKVSSITDVSQVLAAGPVDMQPGDSIVVGFALIAAPTMDGILASVPPARDMWDTINRLYDATDVLAPAAAPEGIALHGVAPHPISLSRGEMSLHVEVARAGRVRIALYDLLGRDIAVLSDRFMEAGRHALPVLLPSLSPGTVLLRVETAQGASGMSLRVIP